MFIKKNQRNPIGNAPGIDMVVFPPIFNIAPQRLNTAARNFVRVFRRLNRTRLLKKNQRNPIRNAPGNANMLAT